MTEFVEKQEKNI